jgi:class 3 adenylate cyclase
MWRLRRIVGVGEPWNGVEAAQTSRLDDLIARVGEAVALDSDNEDERLRKAVMAFSVYLICFGGLFWGVTYAALGLWWSAIIPLAYMVLSLLNIALLYRTKNDRFFLISQLSLILLLPFLLQWSAGGFVSSGGVMLWAILAPVGALMFHGIRASTRWFAAYLALVAVSALIDVPLADGAIEIPAMAVAVFFASNVIMVSTILFLVLRHFVSETEQAKRKSDGLLFHMLPPSIAQRLKDGESPIADRIEEVSVVFADIVDFTRLADELEPEDLVDLLNSVYGAFDHIADDLGVEKIRTVGDAYIAVAGIPQPRDDHARVAVEAATRMRDHLVHLGLQTTESPIEMRFGVHCGPVVAGVIGTQKLNYEVWGDTVNVASRMESTGFPSQVQVSEAIYSQINRYYELSQCGATDIKGKGRMNTYLVGGAKPGTHMAPSPSESAPRPT